MKVGLIARTLIGTTVLALLVSALLIGLIHAIDREQDAARKSARSQEAIATATVVERVVLDVQSSVRGYLLEGDERLLAPCRRPPTGSSRRPRESRGRSCEPA
jgi:CHASE3 domain sensor protein